MRKPTTAHSITKTAPKAALISLLSGLLILLISTFFALRAQSPVTLARPLGMASLYIGTLIGGFYCADRLEGGQAYLSSAIASAMLLLLTIAAKFVLPPTANETSDPVFVITHASIIVSSLLGTLIGLYRPIRRKKHKKHSRSKK